MSPYARVTTPNVYFSKLKQCMVRDRANFLKKSFFLKLNGYTLWMSASVDTKLQLHISPFSRVTAPNLLYIVL